MERARRGLVARPRRPHPRWALRRARDARAVAAPRGLSARERVVALVDALDGAAGPETHTTNLVAVDADGNACVLTTSLGLGSGDWLPGLDVHLNSMLGETDLLRGPLEPGTRMDSMMAPTLVLDDDGLELAIGAAGGTRLRTALLTVLGGNRSTKGSSRRPPSTGRASIPPAHVVNAEPGVDEDGLAALEAAAARSGVGRKATTTSAASARSGERGAAADPRRSGAVVLPGAG